MDFRKSAKKNSIDRWTPLIDHRDEKITQNRTVKEESKPGSRKAAEDLSKKIKVSPLLQVKAPFLKTTSEARFRETGQFVIASNGTKDFKGVQQGRFIYKSKSPEIKILKLPLVNYVSLSPFAYDDVASKSPRYHYRQEFILLSKFVS